MGSGGRQPGGATFFSLLFPSSLSSLFSYFPLSPATAPDTFRYLSRFLLFLRPVPYKRDRLCFRCTRCCAVLSSACTSVHPSRPRKTRAEPSHKGAGAERSGRWEGRTERGRRPQAVGRAQPPLRPAAERSGSTLIFRNKPATREAHSETRRLTYAPGPRQGGVCKGQRLLPVTPPTA